MRAGHRLRCSKYAVEFGIRDRHVILGVSTVGMVSIHDCCGTTSAGGSWTGSSRPSVLRDGTQTERGSTTFRSAAQACGQRLRPEVAKLVAHYFLVRYNSAVKSDR